MPLGAPAGYYQVPGLPYPGRPAIPQPNRSVIDPNDLLATAAAQQDGMGADAGVGTPPPRDPAMNALPRGTLSGAPGASPMTGDASVIRLAPNRTSPFSRADAQALAALDPRVLEEAKGLAKLDTPKTMTATFNGQNFEMTPAARVDRNALARLYAQGQERKAQEQQAKVRGEEQAGKERLVAIPGQQATDRAKIEAEAKAKESAAAREAAAPKTAAEVAALNAKTKADEASAARQERSFVSPEEQAANAAYEQAVASPFARTPEGQARIAALLPNTTHGKRMVPTEREAFAKGAAPTKTADEVITDIMADPGIAKLMENAKATRTGMLNRLNPYGAENRQTAAAARALAERAIQARLQREGVDPNVVRGLLTSIMGPAGR